MDFTSSPFVRKLRSRENVFLQVLLTNFSLKRLGDGSVLSIYFDGDSPTISVREAKHNVKERIPDFEKTAEELQGRLDNFLVEKIGPEFLPPFNNPTFPFRYGSGGALPVLQLDGEEKLLPNEKDEVLVLVDSEGNDRNLRAPRWLCHLLGLRHRSVHILLQWKGPSLGKVFILQIRNWNKSDSPGQLDISVGGHVVGDANKLKTAYGEMEEELGITKEHLTNSKLAYQKGYKVVEEQEENNFFNTEWRDVYLGEISTESLNQIHFNDSEVVGLYLCPESQAKNLLNQKIIPMASALRDSLPFCT